MSANCADHEAPRSVEQPTISAGFIASRKLALKHLWLTLAKASRLDELAFFVRGNSDDLQTPAVLAPFAGLPESSTPVWRVPDES